MSAGAAKTAEHQKTFASVRNLEGAHSFRKDGNDLAGAVS
jgi:hypothetical protein